VPPTKQLLAVLAAASLLVACGDDGGDDVGAGASTTEADVPDTTADTTGATQPAGDCPATTTIDGITVEGEVGEAATITIAEGFAAPAELLVQDLADGDGEQVPAGATVTVHYAGVLLDGTEFDASFGAAPATFPLSGVIEGWTEGIPCAEVGGRRLLVIPAELAYGSQGAGGGLIPPDAPLVFVVDVLAAA
jgi:hypothetical protein